MADRKIKVAVADNNPVVQKGLETILSAETEFETMADYRSSGQLVSDLQSAKIDIIIADLGFDNMETSALATLIQSKFPTVKLMIFTNVKNVFHARTLMQKGASGYILKDNTPAVIVAAVKEVYQGGQVIEPSIRENILQQAITNKKKLQSVPDLTKREREVIELLSSNDSSQEIAGKLHLSKRTVENHRANLLFKFNVKNAAALIKKAIELDLLTS